MIEPLPGEVIGRDVPGPPQPESRFTAPTDECPHPERWSSTDGDSTELEVADLAWGLVRALQPDLCVETGSAFGVVARRIGEALAANGYGWLATLETDRRRAAHVEEVTRGLPVTVYLQSSLNFVPPGSVGFLWLDTFYELRVPEFTRYRPHLAPGCVVCFHDTAPGHGSHRIPSGRDLRSEVDAALGDQLATLHLPTPRGVTVAMVR